MKPIIGVVVRFERISEINNAMVIYENVINAVKKSGGLVIGLIDENIELINLCNGIILQGGNDTSIIDIPILKYCYDKDIPLLGICLGMQMMSLYFNGEINDFTTSKHANKKFKYVHSVHLNKLSKLHEIIGLDYILVNSRHKSYIKNTNLSISGISNDGYIESVEDKNKRFFIGVQWHPETTFEYDIVSQKIFKAFILECQKGKK